MSKTNGNPCECVQKSSKKSEEYRSFNAAKEKLRFLKTLTDVSQTGQESPDFVFIDNDGNRIGIEHFCVDISMGSRKNSGAKETRGKAKEIFNKYHKDIESHLDEARQEIETKILNPRMREWQNFDYQTFCTRFKEILEEHYSEAKNYKAKWNLSSIGFLIEFLVPDDKYMISVKGEPFHLQKLCDFPITTTIWQLLHDALGKLDFIILDTNQYAKKKDSIVLVDKENEPQRFFEEFTPLFKGEKGKVSLNLTG